jgi:ABC-type lipoprotein release transport system permease subunit
MLTLRGLIVRNLAYHWRGNLAVLLGVAVGSAVLTGALLVGDSLRGSLRARVVRQLAGVDAAALFPRPLRADLAGGLPGDTRPVLLLPGNIQAVGADELTAPFLGRITIIGIEDAADANRFRVPAMTGKQVTLSGRVAGKLGLKVGDAVKLGCERFSEIPRSSSLSRRSSADVTATETLTVAAILPEDAPGNDFNLTPNPGAPLNVFVPISTLSRLVTGAAEPVANVLLSTGAGEEELDAALQARLKPEDYALKFRDIDRRGYVSVESTNLVMAPGTVDAILNAAKDLGNRAEPTIAFIADTLAHGEQEIAFPVVVGLNPAAAEPLGPFLPKGVSTLADNEVVLLDWSGSPLNGLPAGTKLRMLYFDPEVEGEGRLKQAELTLRGYIPLAGAARDRDLTPEVRGVTDARAELRDLDRPPVLPREKIRQRVPDKHPRAQFFNTNKATPMAYVNLATGERLFSSRYGSVTSVRIAPKNGESLEQLSEQIRQSIVSRLSPRSAGLDFSPIRQRLLEASQGGTDFGGLFLGFSLFLIVAALMLVGLLFRLTLDRRASEVGLLLATGYSVGTIRWVLLAEGLALTVVGAVLGLGLGVGYNLLLIGVLAKLWPDPEVANILHAHTAALSFALGFGLTLAMAMLALWLSVRGLVKVSPPALLRGETLTPATSLKTRSPVAWAIAIFSFLIGIGSLVSGKFFENPDFQAMSFFGGGGLLLTAGLAGAWIWMKRPRQGVVNGRGWPALARLGGRNTARNRSRSLLTAALLASAAFLLVAVESFRRQPGAEFLEKFGGSGGFNLIAQTDVPLFEPLDRGPGRTDLEQRLREALGDAGGSDRYKAAVAELNALEAYSLRERAGDDASCLNLFQSARPRVLGVADALIERGGFKFYETAAATAEEQANPWLLLQKPLPDGAVPVFCEQNTAEWMLKKGIGDDIVMPGDDGRDFSFRIVGTFADSPFQSELVTSDASFARAFPKTGGYRFFLIRTPPGREQAVGSLLAAAYRANGMIATPTRERVAAYQAVIGAYLSTFQLLGGLGLLLGVLGLAVVVLRGVWERVGELALLRAMGYRPRQLQFLVLAENALLLLVGLGVGVLAAVVSVSPHVADGATVPWARLLGLLALVLIVGIAVASAATAGILRIPVIPALRKE